MLRSTLPQPTVERTQLGSNEPTGALCLVFGYYMTKMMEVKGTKIFGRQITVAQL